MWLLTHLFGIYRVYDSNNNVPKKETIGRSKGGAEMDKINSKFMGFSLIFEKKIQFGL